MEKQNKLKSDAELVPGQYVARLGNAGKDYKEVKPIDLSDSVENVAISYLQQRENKVDDLNGGLWRLHSVLIEIPLKAA